MIDATPLLRLYARARLCRLGGLDPAAEQSRQLLRLVRAATATRFGRDHDFAAIRSVKDYQARVPLRRYGDFWADYWQPGYPLLDDVTWPGRIPYFAFTSGTSSGASKYVPVSRQMLAANRRAAIDVLVHHVQHRPGSRIWGGRNFMLGGSTDLVELAPGVLRGDLSGIVANEIPAWAAPLFFPPKRDALIADWDLKIERLARLSLSRDVRVISGTPSWVLLFFEKLAELAPPGQPPYPNLELYIHGGVGFRPYLSRFQRLFAQTGTAMREVYPASEGFIALADRGFGDGLRLMLDNGLFFEFVAVEELEKDSPTRHWVADIETGVDYAILLSSCAGLWSYVLGDTVRFVDRAPPRLLVTGRTSYMMHAFGEHLSGHHLEDAVMTAAQDSGAEVADFAVGALFPGSGRPRGRHLFVIEFTRPPGDPEVFARRLDARLQETSVDFSEHRQRGYSLDGPEVLAVPAGSFAAWMKARGRLGGQNKVPRVINDEALFTDLVEHARRQSASV